LFTTMDPSTVSESTLARHADAATLARLLQASRADTLATFAACERARPDLRVPHREELNLPLWELGHIGWFQEYWLARNPERHRGHRADPEASRLPPLRASADALYDSTRVPHARRWTLDLPGADATRRDLAAQLERTLALLGEASADDDALYFFRLALLHEDMHHEAALYMAHGLGIATDDARWQPPRLPAPPGALRITAGPCRLGSEAGAGFAFDNELPGHDVGLAAFDIDIQVLRWAEYLPFVEAGVESGGPVPATLRRDGSQWQQWHHGDWHPLDPTEPARHLRFDEALAWCRWSGRRLPTEAEWEHAAMAEPDRFRWGDVWEWTASSFGPFPGFEPHPYRDYSAPWFDGRPVLKGGSFMTQPRLKHTRYRNFFLPHRCDVAAGLRTCSL
jgi:ergothioneine biosynthesis protein EgtB